jgi:putative glutamine amidotransferase
VAPGSRLAAAVGEELARCTSHHHQGVATIGEGLEPVAWAPDGLVEALEPADPRAWFVAVQWHPEATAADDPGQQALFDAFAAEVRARAAAG